MRGILGEVGNVTLTSKPVASTINKPKTIQQQSIASIIESKAIVTVPPPALPSTIPMMIHRMENITLDEGRESDESMSCEPLAKLTKVPPEFDCDRDRKSVV